MEMMYTRTWYTIPKTSGKFTFTCGDCRDFKVYFSSVKLHYQKEEEIEQDFKKHLSIPFGYYSSMQEIVAAMNTAISDAMPQVLFPVIREGGERTFEQLSIDKWPHFKYNDVKKKIFIDLQGGGEVGFDDYFANLLGVRSNPIVNNGKYPKLMGGNKASDIKGGIHGLYVYCDALENVPVGDTEAPLLRVVDATGHNGENVHRVFDPLRYIPLRKKQFDSIEIDIRDDIGLPISFEGGKLIVTLHFRRAANPYFST